MFNRILIPLDGSKLAESVFPYAVDMAVTRKSSVELVTVFEPFQIPPHIGMVFDEDNIKEYNKSSQKSHFDYLQKIKQFFEANGIETNTTVLQGKVDETLIDYANSNEFDLIIMATHGRSGVERWIMGSVADKFIHYSVTPILLVRVLPQK
ncbi:MAG: universal stress protein [Dehalococcoidia bacterium]|nr:universal stress protein [Dehalococcoidia bacterium]